MKSIYTLLENTNHIKISNLVYDGDIDILYDVLADINESSADTTKLAVAVKAFLNSKNAVVKALYKYSPYIIALKPLAKIIYDVIYDRILAKGVEHDFKHLSVDIKRYDDNSVLCIIKFNNTTLSFLMEKEK